MKSDTGLSIKEIKADGGVAKNEFLMQFQSDISNANAVLPDNPESTAFGAFLLTGLGCGIFKDTEEISGLDDCSRTFTPEMDPETRQRLLDGWNEAINKILL